MFGFMTFIYIICTVHNFLQVLLYIGKGTTGSTNESHIHQTKATKTKHLNPVKHFIYKSLFSFFYGAGSSKTVTVSVYVSILSILLHSCFVPTVFHDDIEGGERSMKYSGLSSLRKHSMLYKKNATRF
jgi:hypothetical protein